MSSVVLPRYPMDAELIVVDYKAGVQTYLRADGEEEHLMGWNRASNVKVGDRGRLVYRTGRNYGLPFFEKDASVDNSANK